MKSPWALSILKWVLLSASAHGGVVVNSNPTNPQTLPGPNYSITPDKGVSSGKNLFHSFKSFSLDAGETATFSGPNSVRNVFARVTGGAPSHINGTLRSTMPSADFYFINPAGVLFHADAQLDVKGSFTVTTADFIKLGANGRFDAKHPSQSVLNSAPPTAFGFLGKKPAPLTATGGALVNSALAVPAGQTFRIVAGDISIHKTNINAFSGNIAVASVGSPGEVDFDPDQPTKLLAQNFTRLGDIALTGASGLTIDGNGGGSILIRAGNLSLAGNSFIVSQTSGFIPGGAIDLKINQTITMTDSVIFTTAFSSVRGGDVIVEANRVDLLSGNGGSRGIACGTAGANGGRSGNLSLRADILNIRSGASLGVDTFGTGDGGALTVRAREININRAGVVGFTGISAETQDQTAGGRGGSIDIRADSITLLKGARISVVTRGTGDAGSININAEHILLRGANAQFQEGTDIAADSTFATGGKAGNITLRSKSLFIGAEAFISSGTFGAGDGGALDLTVDQFTIVGNIFSTLLTGVSTATLGSGDGGNIRINAASLSISNLATINADTRGQGAGGSVHINAQRLLVDRGATISTTSNGGAQSGPGGDIVINADRLELHALGSIFAEVLSGPAQGGDISITSKHISLDNETSLTQKLFNIPIANPVGEGTINLQAAFTTSIDTATQSQGNGGNIRIVTDRLDVRHNAFLSTAAFGQGNAGNLSIDAKEIHVSQDGSKFATGIFSPTFLLGGDGGNISVRTRSLEVINGGIIAADTFGPGKGGDISISADSVLLSGDGAPITGISVQTHSPTNGGAGGNLSIRTGTLEVQRRAVITAATSGSGKGGSVPITADSIQLDSGVISSSSQFLADAGSITIHAGSELVMTNNSGITTAAAKANGGDTTITGAGRLSLNQSKITTQAGKDGGSIVVNFPDSVSLANNSKITAEAGGNGGNITIDPDSVALNHSQIIANAIQGNGGNILITTSGFLTSESIISASSKFGLAGSIQVITGNPDIVNSLIPLQTDLAPPDARFQDHCELRLSTNANSFIVKGRGATRVAPDGFVPSLDLRK